MKKPTRTLLHQQSSVSQTSAALTENPDIVEMMNELNEAILTDTQRRTECYFSELTDRVADFF